MALSLKTWRSLLREGIGSSRIPSFLSCSLTCHSLIQHITLNTCLLNTELFLRTQAEQDRRSHGSTSVDLTGIDVRMSFQAEREWQG